MMGYTLKVDEHCHLGLSKRRIPLKSSKSNTLFIPMNFFLGVYTLFLRQIHFNTEKCRGSSQASHRPWLIPQARWPERMEDELGHGIRNKGLIDVYWRAQFRAVLCRCSKKQRQDFNLVWGIKTSRRVGNGPSKNNIFMWLARSQSCVSQCFFMFLCCPWRSILLWFWIFIGIYCI